MAQSGKAKSETASKVAWTKKKTKKQKRSFQTNGMIITNGEEMAREEKHHRLAYLSFSLIQQTVME